VEVVAARCVAPLDPQRTAPPPSVRGDPAAAWARRVLDTELLCVRRSDGRWDAPPGVTFAAWIRGQAELPPPTTADLDYHISTLFPPVRPRGHLEVRYLDAQPGRRWALPAAVLAALLHRPGCDGPRAAGVRAHSPAAGCRPPAMASADRVLQRAAVTVFELAVATLPRLDAPSWLVADLAVMLERRVRRGLCPADLHTTGPHRAGPAGRAHRAGPAGRTPPAGPADVPEEARA
jgi:glutamate--cysteine ligase